MLNIVITGAHSFIGNALARRLGEFPERYRVRLVSVRGDDWRGAGFAGADCVVHAAGIAHVNAKDVPDGEYLRVNRDLTVEVARRAKADGVGQFVFLSSVIVYGEASPAGERRTITASTPAAPAGAYGQSKLEAEQGLLKLADEGFRVAILRPPMVYGPGCKGNYRLLAKLARLTPLFPDFDNRRSLLYVENLAECLRLIVDGGLEGLFFPQDGVPLSTAGIVRHIAAATGRRVDFARWLNPLVRLAGRGGIVRRAFGDVAVDPALSDVPRGYRRFTTEEGIRRSEAGQPTEH